MKLLVIGAGLMGSAAAYDMARSPGVTGVTLVDADARRAKDAGARIQQLLKARSAPLTTASIDAADVKAVQRLMAGHNATLSAVPYFFNEGLCRAAIAAGCHFADLGGNNTVVRKEYDMSSEAERKGVAIAPDCGLSPGMASILAGDLVRRMRAGGAKSGKKPAIDALKLYVGGLPKKPLPPFEYQMVFSIEGLINEYVEPARILRGGKMITIEPLTEPEEFHIKGFRPMVAFHTSGGTSTMPESFAGEVGECFEKTLRYPDHFKLIRGLYDLGFFSSEKRRVGNADLTPRQLTSQLFLEKMSSDAPDVTIMRIEAHRGKRELAYELVDSFDPRTRMTSMMRTTAWPASVVVQMMASGVIATRGGVRQELDVPADLFLKEMAKRGVKIKFS